MRRFVGIATIGVVLVAVLIATFARSNVNPAIGLCLQLLDGEQFEPAIELTNTAMALQIASRTGNLVELCSLLAGGADAKSGGNAGASPLHAAALEDQVDVARVLLAAGASAEAADHEGYTPVHAAVFAASWRSSSGDVASDVRTEEAEAAHADNLTMARVLLRSGGAEAANAVNSQGLSALHVAASLGHTGFINALVLAGAAMDLRDHGGLTALHIVAMSDRVDAARALINGGADVDAKDDDGASPLHSATVCDSIGVRP